ncbi:MAG: DUF945 family protein [Legionellales bacterium]|nr:DUF945 family protein [Legionellales bacterium]
MRAIKKLSIALLIVILIGLSLPPLMGFIAEKDLNRFIAHLQKKLPYKITLQNYQQGWFSSTAQLSVRLPQTQPRKDFPIDLQITMSIHHGPIAFIRDKQQQLQWFAGIAVSQLNVHFSNEVESVIQLMIGKPLTLQGKLAIGFRRQFHVSMANDGLNFQFHWAKESIEVKWGGFNFRTNLNSAMDVVQSKWHSKPFYLKINNQLIDIGDVVAQNNWQKEGNLTHLFFGKAKLFTSKIKFNVDNEMVELNQPSLQARGFLSDADNYNLVSTFSLKSSTLFDRSVGPGVIKLNITDLNPTALEQAFVKFNQLQAGFNNHYAYPFTTLYFQAGENNKVTVQLKINHFAVDNQPISANLNMSFPQGVTLPQDVMLNKNNVDDLLGAKLLMTGEMSLPAVFVDEIIQHAANKKTLPKPFWGTTLADWKQQQIIQAVNGAYTIQFQLKDKKLTVNQHVVE